MTDYSELIRKARAVPGPTLLMTYPTQTTPDPLSNALADAIEDLQNRVTFEAAANLATAKLNANLLKRIAELEVALEPFADMDYWVEPHHNAHDSIEQCNQLTVAEILAARAALNGEK
jgi:hypothetical protein